MPCAAPNNLIRLRVAEQGSHNVNRDGAGSIKAMFLLAVAALGGAAMPGVASADTLTANVAVVSDYRFRGISQSFRRPALQGGADYGHDSGLYVGTWASTVDKDFLTDTNGVELDIYGGYKFPLGADWMIDVGLLQYLYPGESLWNTTELYIAATWKIFYLKYSHSISDDTFGFADSRGSGYLDLTATYPLQEGFNLIAHVGHQRFRNYSDVSYSDYRLGATYDWAGLTWGASVYGTSQDFTFTKPNGKTKDLGRSALVVSVGKTF
jgi:uncharacterized protein (TIGR02001 family)